MLKRVVIASEISPEATLMLHQLKSFHDIGTDECLLLYCVEPMGAVPDAKQIAKQKKLLESYGYQVETRIVNGYPQDELNKIACQEGYSFLASPEVDKSLLKDYYILERGFETPHHADKPVLFLPVQKAGEMAKTNENLLEHVLFTTDFSENASLAFEYLKKLAEKAKNIRILHVQDKRKFDQYTNELIAEYNEIDAGRLEAMKECLHECGCSNVETGIILGLPCEVILDYVREHGCTMVIMGSQGRGYARRKFLGSVSQTITKETEIPILLIPARTEN